MNKVINALILFVLLGISGLLSWYGLTKGHNWGGDFSSYIMQAQWVWQGKPSQFLLANRFTVEESTRAVGPIAYPWGFPVLLAPFYAYFGLNMLALKSLNIIFYLIFLISLWFGFRRYHSYLWRAILVCFFAFNPYFLKFMNNILSDIPFLFFSTLSVLLIGRVVIQRHRLVSDISDQMLLGVLIAISFFIRTQGILILAALGVTQFIEVAKNTIAQNGGPARVITRANDSLLKRLVRRSSILWIFILPHVSFLIVILLWRSVLPEGGSSHISLFEEVSYRLIISNLKYYLDLPATLFTGAVGEKVLYMATIPLTIIGILKRRECDYHIFIYGVMTMLLLLVWPFKQGLRFLFPLLPFYLSFVLTGLEKCLNISHGPWKALWKVVGLCPVFFILILFLKSSILNASENLVNHRTENTGPYLSTSTELFSFITNNTETNSIIVFRKPRVMTLFTNRKSMVIDQKNKLTRGDYLCISILLDASYQLRFKELVSLTKNGRIHLIYRNKDFLLFQIKKMAVTRRGKT